MNPQSGIPILAVVALMASRVMAADQRRQLQGREHQPRWNGRVAASGDVTGPGGDCCADPLCQPNFNAYGESYIRS